MPDVAQLVTAGTRLWGRLPDRPRLANPLDEFSGITRRFRDFRTKEWVGFTLVHRELFGSMIVQDAKYLHSAELYVVDRARGALHEHAANAGGSALALPADLLHGVGGFEKPGFALRYDFDADAGRHGIRIAIDPTATAAGVSGELMLDARDASAPLVVSSRLDRRGATMFTHKRVFAASGSLTVGEQRFDFDPARDFAIIDEHRSALPYRAEWTWGTFAARTPDGDIVGANFAARPQPAGEEEESGLWVGGGAEPLADVRFAHTGAAVEGPWSARSADGRLDVTFTPEGRKVVRKNFGVVAIDYWQAFGTYAGEVAGIRIDDAHGVLERMRMRA